MRPIAASRSRDVEKGKITARDRDAAMGRIHGTVKTEDFSACQLVIEAATENMELKKKIFADLDRITPPDSILATNTSVLSIMDIASATKRTDKVLGLHFFNP